MPGWIAVILSTTLRSTPYIFIQKQPRAVWPEWLRRVWSTQSEAFYGRLASVAELLMGFSATAGGGRAIARGAEVTSRSIAVIIRAGEATQILMREFEQSANGSRDWRNTGQGKRPGRNTAIRNLSRGSFRRSQFGRIADQMV